MRRALGPLLLAALLLTGCGADDTGSDTGSGTGGDDTAADGTDPAPEVLAIVSATAAGGEVGAALTPVPDAGAVTDFLRQLDSSSIAEEVRATVEGADLAEGLVPAAAVVAIGCDVPTEVTVTASGADDGTFTATAAEVEAPLPECLAPVTSVAVVAIPTG